MGDLVVVGEAKEYEEFRGVLRARKEALKISNTTLDLLAGTHDGYAGKVLNDPPIKRMGITTFGIILQALGCKILIVEDEEQMERLATRMVKRVEQQVRNGVEHQPIKLVFRRKHYRKMGKLSAKARMSKIPRWRRRQIARRAARARWSS